MKQRWETNNVCKDGLKAEWLGMIVCTSNNEHSAQWFLLGVLC